MWFSQRKYVIQGPRFFSLYRMIWRNVNLSMIYHFFKHASSCGLLCLGLYLLCRISPDFIEKVRPCPWSKSSTSGFVQGRASGDWRGAWTSASEHRDWGSCGPSDLPKYHRGYRQEWVRQVNDNGFKRIVPGHSHSKLRNANKLEFARLKVYHVRQGKVFPLVFILASEDTIIALCLFCFDYSALDKWYHNVLLALGILLQTFPKIAFLPHPLTRCKWFSDRWTSDVPINFLWLYSIAGGKTDFPCQ